MEPRPEPQKVMESAGQVECSPDDLEQDGDTTESKSENLKGEYMQIERFQSHYSHGEFATDPAYRDVSRKHVRQRLSGLVRNFQMLLMSVNQTGANQNATHAEEHGSDRSL